MSAMLEWRGVRCVLGGAVVIAHLDLAVQAGERVALIGPNGAGKTTLFQLACGLLRAQAGSIRLHGRRIDGMPPHRIAALGLARSFQAPQVFLNLSVRDNLRAVLLARAHADEAADDWLDALGLAAVAERTAGTLDGTLLRLLDLGLALMGDAPVLLLDEPTAGLARDQAERLLGLIESRAAGRTLLLIEHDLDVVFRLARRIVVLHHGAVLADGTPEAIRADREVQSVYLLGATESAT